MRVLDLFCGEGGASAGYAQAGLDVVAGIDLTPRALRRYPFTGYELDWRAGLDKFADDVDLIHASPPCQAYSTSTPKANRANHPDLVAEVREALIETGKPYIIENVKRAPLIEPVYLSGCMFGLSASWVPSDETYHLDKIEWRDGTAYWSDGWHAWENNNSRVKNVDKIGQRVTFHLERVRGFETNWPLTAPERDEELHRTPAFSVVGGSGNPTSYRRDWFRGRVPAGVREQLMGGVDWMSTHGLSESIPPAYTEYIGRELSRQPL